MRYSIFDDIKPRLPLIYFLQEKLFSCVIQSLDDGKQVFADHFLSSQNIAKIKEYLFTTKNTLHCVKAI